MHARLSLRAACCAVLLLAPGCSAVEEADRRTLFYCGQAEGSKEGSHVLSMDKDCDTERYVEERMPAAIGVAAIGVAVFLLFIVWSSARCCCNCMGGNTSNPRSLCWGRPRPRHVKVRKQAHPGVESCCQVRLDGARVDKVEPQGPAAAAGVEKGWVVASVGEQRLHSIAHSSPLDEAWRTSPEVVVIEFRPPEVKEEHLAIQYTQQPCCCRSSVLRGMLAVCVALGVCVLAIALAGLPKFRDGHRGVWNSLVGAATWIEGRGDKAKTALTLASGATVKGVDISDVDEMMKAVGETRTDLEQIDLDTIDRRALIVALVFGSLPAFGALCAAPCALWDARGPLSVIGWLAMNFAAVQWLGCAAMLATHVVLTDTCAEVRQLSVGDNDNFLGGVLLNPMCPQKKLSSVRIKVVTAKYDNLDSACNSLRAICSDAQLYDPSRRRLIYVCDEDVLFGPDGNGGTCRESAARLPFILASMHLKTGAAAAGWGCKDPTASCSPPHCAQDCVESEARDASAALTEAADAAARANEAIDDLYPLLNCSTLWETMVGGSSDGLVPMAPGCDSLLAAANSWRIALAMGGATLTLVAFVSILGSKRFRSLSRYVLTRSESPVPAVPGTATGAAYRARAKNSAAMEPGSPDSCVDLAEAKDQSETRGVSPVAKR
eukprot:TRINITY_DN24819_c0_g1_i1.p1 TRINITY_DN24819_c0_g1~~TRINITY_DN24819_c0_g1_i1.p1  ORF type:complete len:662 (+),score=75.08 TRINITY_DN24819_c0_g1_i1:76-2061(+)